MTEKTEKKLDLLTDDEPITGQNWVCLSFLSPEGIKNCSTRGIKVRGVFPTRQEAEEHALALSKKDPDFDIFVGEVGKWLPWNPDPNDVKDQKYQEEELQKIMDAHKESLEKAKKMQQQIKKDKIENAAREEQSKQEERMSKLKTRMKNKLEKKKAQQKMDNMALKQLTNEEKELKEKEEDNKMKDKIAKEEKNRLDDMEKVINDKKNNLNDIDNTMSKIQELYAKINKKK